MDPVLDSITKHFYDRGWRGINIEPAQKFFEELARERLEDINLPVAVGDAVGVRRFFEVANTGLSTLSEELTARHRAEGHVVEAHDVEVTTLAHICDEFVTGDIDFLKIDVEGWERLVINGADWNRYRPKVILVEAVVPNSPEPAWQSWEPLLCSNGYAFAYFDGLNRFYVRQEDSHLAQELVRPPNVFDHFVPFRVHQAEGERDALRQENQRLKEAAAKLETTLARLEHSLCHRLRGPFKAFGRSRSLGRRTSGSCMIPCRAKIMARSFAAPTS